MVYKTLVSAAELMARPEGANWAVVDCRFDLGDPAAGRRAYHEGHIPGAIYLDLEAHLSGPVSERSGRHPLPDPDALARCLGERGINQSVQVVAYDAGNGAFASRLWWLLHWLGHDRAALLDGGLTAWLAAGGSLSTDVPESEAREFKPGLRPYLSVATRDIDLESDHDLLLDARSAQRFSGELEPIDPVAGHIPGAINLPFEGNLGPDGRFLPPEQLKARFEGALAGRRPAEVVHYCGSGVTACHNLLAMEHADLAGSRLYVGSWSEWIRDERHPIATGEQPLSAAAKQPG